MPYGLLNFGSLLLGLLAWILPLIGLAKCKTNGVFILTSVSACAISLFMQILYTNYLIGIEDWSALMDTSRAVMLASSILVVVTIALNLIMLLVGRIKSSA